MPNFIKNNSDRIVSGIAILLVLTGIIWFSRVQLDYAAARNMYERTRQEYVEVKGDTTGEVDISEDGTASEDWRDEVVSLNLKELQRLNPDIAGWLYFENEEISYPILYGDTNEKYIRTSPEGKSSRAGSIFLDEENNRDFSDEHTIIYGHNMRDLTMFGRLKYYSTQKDYYDSHEYFQIIGDGFKNRYRVIAYKSVAPNGGIYRIVHRGDSDFDDFVEGGILEGSMLAMADALDPEAGLDRIDGSRQMVTLSTCSAGDTRFVVTGCLVDTDDMSMPLLAEADVAEDFAAPEPTVKPEPTAEPTVKPEPTAEPTEKPEPTAEPTVKPEPTAEPESEKEIKIENGLDSYRIAKLLQEAGLIEDAKQFDSFLCNDGYDRKLKSGRFLIPSGASEEEIAHILVGK